MCLDEKNYQVISHTLPRIRTETQNDTFIFAFYNNPLYYFLADKQNPTKYIDFNISIEKKEERAVIEELRQSKVRSIITRFPPLNSQSQIIAGYIEKNYIPTQTVYEFTVWNYRF
jgi:hypothetical protein